MRRGRMRRWGRYAGLWPRPCDGVRSAVRYAAASAFRRPSGSALIARNSVRAGPLGFFAPRSHSCTVRMLRRKPRQIVPASCRPHGGWRAHRSPVPCPVQRRDWRRFASPRPGPSSHRSGANPLLQAHRARPYLRVFSIALHLSSVRLAKRDHPSLRVPVRIDTHKKPMVDRAKCHLTTLARSAFVFSNLCHLWRTSFFSRLQGGSLRSPI